MSFENDLKTNRLVVEVFVKSLNIRPAPAKPASDPEHQITYLLGLSSLCMSKKVAPYTTIKCGEKTIALLESCLLFEPRNLCTATIHYMRRTKLFGAGKTCMELTLKSQPKPLHCREL